MRNKTTVLRAQRDDEFLAAKRQDPVTGRVFVPGNRVTLCAVCRLPFLEESWRGIGGTHCGQLSSVGLDASEASAEPPVSANEGDTDGANTNGGQAAVNESAGSMGLMPIPIHLSQIPITLR